MSGFSVKKWRSAMGFSRKQAAERLGVSPHTIKSYELLQRDLPSPVEQLMRKIEREKHGALGSVPGSSIRILGGGTLLPITQEVALTAVSFGATAKALLSLCQAHDRKAELLLTRFADPTSSIHTVSDVEGVARSYIADPNTKIVFWNPAMVEYTDHTLFLTNEEGDPVLSTPLVSPHKIPRFIKDKRPDIFVVVFQTTNGATCDEQRAQALKLLRATTADLVLAKDNASHMHMVVASEQTVYHTTGDKEVALAGLVEMALHRSQSQPLRTLLLSQTLCAPLCPQTAEYFDTVAATAVVEHIPLTALCVRQGHNWVCSRTDFPIGSHNAVVLKTNEQGEWLCSGGRPHALGLSVGFFPDGVDCVAQLRTATHGEDARLMDRNTVVFAEFLAAHLGCAPLVLDNGDTYVCGKQDNVSQFIKQLRTYAEVV